MNRVTQQEVVLKHLKSGNTLTPDTAVQMWKIHRLADVVFKLRNRGHQIITRKVANKNEGHHAEYALLEAQ